MSRLVRKLLASVCLFTGLHVYSASAQTPSDASVQTLINTNITENASGSITGAVLNNVLQNVLSVAANPVTNLSLTGDVTSTAGSSTTTVVGVEGHAFGTNVAAALGSALYGTGSLLAVNNGALPTGLTIPGAVLSGTTTFGTIGLTDNGDNQLQFASGKSIALAGSGSLQVGIDHHGALIGNDGAANDVVVVPDGAVTNLDTDMVLVQPAAAGDFFVVNGTNDTRQIQLIMGAPTANASNFVIGETVGTGGTCIPINLQSAGSQVAATITCNSTLELPNNVALYARNHANTNDIPLLFATAADHIAIGYPNTPVDFFGLTSTVVGTPTPTADGQTNLVQLGSKAPWAIYGNTNGWYHYAGSRVAMDVVAPTSGHYQNGNAFESDMAADVAWDSVNATTPAAVGFQPYCYLGVTNAACFGINPSLTDSIDGTTAKSFAGTLAGGEIDLETANAGTSGVGFSFEIQGPVQASAGVLVAYANQGSTARWSNGFELADGALAAGGAGVLLGTEGVTSGTNVVNIVSDPIVFNELDGAGAEHHIYMQAYPNSTILLSDGLAPNGLAFEMATSGNAPVIAALGSDANINLKLTPKGTGSLQITGDFLDNAAPDNGPLNVKMRVAGQPTTGYFENFSTTDDLGASPWNTANYLTVRDIYQGNRGANHGNAAYAGDGNGPVIDLQSWSRRGTYLDAITLNGGLESAVSGAECSDLDVNGYLHGASTGLVAVDACGGGVSTQPAFLPGSDLAWDMGAPTRRWLDGNFGGTVTMQTAAISGNMFITGTIVTPLEIGQDDGTTEVAAHDVKINSDSAIITSHSNTLNFADTLILRNTHQANQVTAGLIYETYNSAGTLEDCNFISGGLFVWTAGAESGDFDFGVCDGTGPHVVTPFSIHGISPFNPVPAVYGDTDNAYDVGTSGLRYRNAYFGGVGQFGSIKATGLTVAGMVANDATGLLSSVAVTGAGNVVLNSGPAIGNPTIVGALYYSSLPTGTPTSYACFAAGGELISSSTAC